MMFIEHGNQIVNIAQVDAITFSNKTAVRGQNEIVFSFSHYTKVFFMDDNDYARIKNIIKNLCEVS